MFSISVENLDWISGDGTDDADDLCLHGHASLHIDTEIFDYDATVSATGIYLLRTLTENHIIHSDQPMFPCCGHFLIASADLNSVDISGCPNGVDFSVIHEAALIRVISETGKEILVSTLEYENNVIAFVDKIECFYQNSSSKNLEILTSFDRNGYIAFWNEWKRLKGNRR
jgi:hypothetical protein